MSELEQARTLVPAYTDTYMKAVEKMVAMIPDDTELPFGVVSDYYDARAQLIQWREKLERGETEERRKAFESATKGSDQHGTR